MPDNEMILYDLPCKQGKVCWSPNVWRTRMLLNYKKLPYRTVWIDFPDIEPTLRSYGVEAQNVQALGAAVGARYTLPTVRLPDGSFAMDSEEIAAKIEEMYPDPPVTVDAALQNELQEIMRSIALPLYPELAPHIRDNLLTEHGKQHWVSAREEMFGMSIDEFHESKGGPQAWEDAKPGLNQLRHFLRSHKADNGPFILGSQVSFADFMIAAFLIAAKKAKDEFLSQILDRDEELTGLHRACGEWVVQDH